MFTKTQTLFFLSFFKVMFFAAHIVSAVMRWCLLSGSRILRSDVHAQPGGSVDTEKSTSSGREKCLGAVSEGKIS